MSVLAVLRHLNYRPWFALGEFVDNSVQSFTDHKEALRAVESKDFRLRVEVSIDSTPPSRILIRDNAAGILERDYGRAFRPAAIPPDRTGLAEFGMGMKSAACWFAPRWSVRTSALGESVERTVRFDIQNIVTDDITELVIRERQAPTSSHYTEIVLDDVFHVPVTRTVGKIKQHLADIYREFVRRGILDLTFNGESLEYDEPAVLHAPYFKENEGVPRLWRKSIAFDFGNDLRVSGFAALREQASTSRAGFALFRRDRVIQGSGDEGYRPRAVFGASNSYRYQRLFGELHLEGFDVSHTKDGFRWDENEQPFLDLLREHLDSDDLPLLKQAEGYRVRATRDRLEAAAEEAVQSTTGALEARLAPVASAITEARPVETPSEAGPRVEKLASRCFAIEFRARTWEITVELTEDPAEGEWLSVTETAGSGEQPRRLGIRVSMAHPFMVRFAQTDAEDVDALLRVAAAISVAEVLARESGVRMAGTVRRNVNEILRDALAEV